VLLDPYRLLLLFAAHRHLQRDIVGRTVLAVPVAKVEVALHTQPGCVLGGFSAAVAHEEATGSPTTRRSSSTALRRSKGPPQPLPIGGPRC
jgi:hypothetical protein